MVCNLTFASAVQAVCKALCHPTSGDPPSLPHAGCVPPSVLETGHALCPCVTASGTGGGGSPPRALCPVHLNAASIPQGRSSAPHPDGQCELIAVKRPAVTHFWNHFS